MLLRKCVPPLRLVSSSVTKRNIYCSWAGRAMRPENHRIHNHLPGASNADQTQVRFKCTLSWAEEIGSSGRFLINKISCLCNTSVILSTSETSLVVQWLGPRIPNAPAGVWPPSQVTSSHMPELKKSLHAATKKILQASTKTKRSLNK